MPDVISSLMLLILLATLAGLLVRLGWRLALDHFRRELEVMQDQRDALDAEWRALDNTRRVREVFLLARRAMQRAAQPQQYRDQSGLGES